jgi:hypothetical protein
MMRTLLAVVLCLGLYAADDDWAKVKQTKSGIELRVFKKGSAQPILAKMDEATDERLIIVVKNEQTAIDREQIDRIEYRPPGGKSVTRETKSTMDPPAGSGAPQRGPSRGTNVPGQSSSSSIMVGDKPGFELLYRRPAGSPNTNRRLGESSGNK